MQEVAAAAKSALDRLRSEGQERDAELVRLERGSADALNGQARIAGELAETHKMFAEELGRAEQGMDLRSEQALGTAEAEVERVTRELAEAHATLREVQALSEDQARRQARTERALQKTVANERAARREAERTSAVAHGAADHERGRREAIELELAAVSGSDQAVGVKEGGARRRGRLRLRLRRDRGVGSGEAAPEEDRA